ncbi:MAG: hypothetical protein ACJ8JD_04860 [Chthoniobacterales bacterium]
MKALLVVVLIVGLSAAFILQRRSEQAAPAQPAKVSAVSEHDWAKHSLNRAAEVKREVLRERASNNNY